MVPPTEKNYANIHSNTKNKLSDDNPTNFMDSIKIDPDNILHESEKEILRQKTFEYSSVFTPHYGAYNNKAGFLQADVLLGKNTPPPKKGKIPSYNTKMAELLQLKFDELVEQGVLIRPEAVNVTVAHTSPSFLVKKPSGGHRLVTSFVELNKYHYHHY